MKKWFVMLCLSFISVVTFAQVVPQSSTQGKLEKEKQNTSASGMSALANYDNKLLKPTHTKLHSRIFGPSEQALDKMKAPLSPRNPLKTAVERQIMQAQQTQEPYWPHEDGITDAVAPVSSDRPSYYAQDAAYINCNQIDMCKSWAQEQAQKDVHFQILSAMFSMSSDGHNQRLEVRYLLESDDKVQVFEEDFGSWRQID